MTALGALFLLILVPLVLAVLIGKIERRPLRTIAILTLIALTFVTGIAWEKMSFVNNHIDMCDDQTAGYYRKNNHFDPYCKVLDK